MTSFNCIICSDLLNASEEIYGTRCGHAFHYTCLLNWVERSKTCPQCRTKTTESNIFRLYFNVVNSEGITLDVGVLQNKLDNAEFSLRGKSKEATDLKEEIVKLKSKNEIYKTETKETKHKLESKEIAIKMLKEQVDYLKDQNNEIDHLKETNHKLKRSLDSCKNLNDIITATADDVKLLLDENLDVQKLCTWVTVLKKHVLESESKKKILRESVRKLQNELTEEHGKNTNMKNRIRDMEESITDLENKIKEKDLALVQNVSQSSKEDISDIIFETPDTKSSKSIYKRKRDMGIDDPIASTSEAKNSSNEKISDSSGSNQDSPYFTLRQGNPALVKLNIKKKLITSPTKFTIFNVDKITKFGNSNIPMLFKSSSSLSSEKEMSYDGLGGHSKLETFPSAQHKKVTALQPKKVKSIFKRVQRPPDQQTLDSLFKK